MPTIFSNHLTVTGSADRLREFSRWCGLNEGMLDVDDGAVDAARFGKRTNYHNHKRFIDFIKTETDTLIDRMRQGRIRTNPNPNPNRLKTELHNARKTISSTLLIRES